MIEVIYKDEKQEAKGNESIFSVPKNIRQIGQANDDYRIYMEDYVYTFLGREAGAGDVNGEEKKMSGGSDRGNKVGFRNHLYVYQRGSGCGSRGYFG